MILHEWSYICKVTPRSHQGHTKDGTKESHPIANEQQSDQTAESNSGPAVSLANDEATSNDTGDHDVHR